jgi:fructose-bisphosphate aldolase class 1
MQASALKAWNGNDSNSKAVQEALAKRAACNAKASIGQYSN